MCQIQDKQTMCPTINTGEAKTQPAKIGVRIQNLCCFHSEGDRIVGSVDHVVLLGSPLVDVVNESISRIPARPTERQGFSVCNNPYSTHQKSKLSRKVGPPAKEL